MSFLFSIALGQVPSEEVVVYADDFARWDHTRWFLEGELVRPYGTDLASRGGQAFTADAFQAGLVLRCDKDTRLLGRRWEITCDIEDVALRVIAIQWQTETGQRTVAGVLDELDARLTGSTIQVQVDRKGGTTTVHLEGFDDHRSREDRAQDESLRGAIAQLFAGFDLQVPDHATALGTHEERNPLLMRLPGLLPSGGSTRWVHTVSRHDQLQVVQSIADGVAMLPMENPNLAFPFNCPIIGDTPSATCVDFGRGPIGGDMDQAVARGNIDGPLLGVDLIYELSGVSVAVFDRATGIPIERVWTLLGEGRVPGMSVVPTPYWNRGRLQMIGPSERPDVGDTAQVAAPQIPREGLPTWRPIDG